MLISGVVSDRLRLSVTCRSNQRGKVLLKSRRAPLCGAAIVTSLLLTVVSFPTKSRAQFHPGAAPGFDISVFADPTNVPDFNSAFRGPVSIAFDSRGRLFVGTGAGNVLILLDNNEDGRVDQVKTFATGLPQPFGLEFRGNGDLYVTSNIVVGAGRVVRLRDTNGDDVADNSTIIVDGLPS